MKDRAKRHAWERRMEENMRARGITGQVMMPDSSPMVMVEKETEEPTMGGGSNELAGRY